MLCRDTIVFVRLFGTRSRDPAIKHGSCGVWLGNRRSGGDDQYRCDL